MGEVLSDIDKQTEDLEQDAPEYLDVKRPRTVFEALGKEALASPAMVGTSTLIPDGHTVTGTAANIDTDYAYREDSDP